MRMPRAFWYSYLIRLFVTACLVPSAVFAAAGDVDPAFGPPSFSNFTGSGLAVNTIKVQSDGKVIVGGVFEQVGGVTCWSIARLNQDGSRDTTFNSPFIYTTTQPQVYDVEILSSGKIIVGGYLITPSGVKRLMRLNSDGSVDTSFSADPNNGGLDVIVQPDGKLLVIGAASGVRRLNADGSIDTGFGDFLTDVRAIALQSDGKVVVAGNYSGFFAIFRFNPTGEQDTFGTGWVAANNYIHDIVLQPDGRFIVSGMFTSIGGTARNMVARLTQTGTVDASFVAPVSSISESVYESEVQSDGKILSVGRFRLDTGTTVYQTSRFKADGTLDTSFSRLVEQSSLDHLRTATLRDDGKIMVGGNFTALVSGGLSELGGTSNLVAQLLNPPPSAATVTIGGRVLSAAQGWGVSGVSVTLTSSAGETRSTRTNAFGYFSFDGSRAGETYVLSASSKRYSFAPRTVEATDDISEIEIVAEQ